MRIQKVQRQEGDGGDVWMKWKRDRGGGKMYGRGDPRVIGRGVGQQS